ncbi:metal ABC transporter solute-binding protein, Zn/Mn family [Specibacter sp. NPDC057265]|uniref:metal ABC transporter solute-binding protein, Zn/Mn family n=1 Tax=Specibacter sp. NPDC057265 TaxID=3346075 RepID=UPI003637B216
MLFPRRISFPLAAAAAAALTLSACAPGGTAAEGGAGAPDTISVVAATNVYGSIAQQVGGSHVSVHSIISQSGADPHGYEANAQDKLAVSKADLGIENGGGYDDFFGQLAKGQVDDANVINVSELSGLEADSGAGEEFNEHLWYSLPTMGKLADELAGRFSAAQPEQAADFAASAAAFKEKLAALQSRLDALAQLHRDQPAAVTEPVPLYLLEAAGLSNQTPEEFTEAVEDGSDVPAPVLKQTLELMRSEGLGVLAYNAQTSSAQTEEVKAAAVAAGVPVVDFAETMPDGHDYVQWMDANTTALEQALGQAPQAASGQ